jgi:hypothetical protein
MADFLDGLSSVLEQQFTLGENKLKSLDVVKNGTTVPYGRLGQFANKFDQSAERSYTEEGMFRTDLFNPRAKQLEIWMQEPDVTILVKKRAFSSLVENYRNDFLSKEERLFIRATKFLFQNKCKQLAAYERLTKIQGVATEIGHVDYHLLPVLFAATDALDGLFSAFGSSAFGQFKAIVDRVRTIVNLSQPNIYTTWTTNVLNSFRTDLGEGTGVIEFTTGFNLDTTTSVHFGSGRFNIGFIDPHEIMRITHNDIEQAIGDATNVVFGHSLIQMGIDTLNNTVQDNKTSLNKIRSRRGANPINFIVNSDTYLGKRVRAIIDNSGIEIQFEGSILNVDIDPAYLAPDGGIAGNDGLSKEEAKIFSQIVRALFNSMQINKNSRTVARSHNAETNDLRKKLRLHYGSKLMIQPMDIVNIFVSSKTRIDNKILGGLQDSFNALGFLQTANKALTSLQDLMSVDRDSIDKSIFVGKDFPNWLWRIMRNQFTVDKSGTQIFSGLAETATSNYDNGGTFTVNISGSDNSSYFNFGVVNFKPALDVWNGSLYDPITPFDIKFDKSTGFQKDAIPKLLQENQELFKSAFVKYKNGVYVGKKPTLNNFVQDTERVQNASVRRVFYDPDGMVYKWKEGIGTLVMFGNNYEESATTNGSVPPITTDPFAGQDIMNVLSLLITGEPYNFTTFYKAASQFDNFARDPITGSDPSVSYFKNLQTDIKKRNLLYGNFVPFKKLSMDTETYKNILTSQIRTESFDRELTELLEKKAELNDRISFLQNPSIGAGISIEANNLQAQLSNDIEPKIAAKMQQINDELNKVNKPISLVGNDISFDYDPFLNDAQDKNRLNDHYNVNRDIRRRINYLTRRPSWKVRANEDVNFFIVDDSYDKDYDIQAFEKAFENPALFRSDYVTVAEKIKQIKDLLDLEVFADSQGHIQVRPPRYNKVPSSVFYRMLRLKEEFDIQLYPQFLEDMYVSQIENILSRLEIIEDEIRMYGLSLSRKTDQEVEDFIASTQTQIKSNTPSSRFKFISDENTGATSRLILKDMSMASEADANASLFASGLNALSSVRTQSTINNIFSVTSRVNVFKDLSSSKKSVTQVFSDTQIKTRKDIISARLQTKTGQTFDLNQLFSNSQKLLGGAQISSVDLLKIMQEISFRISERQRILKIAANAIKNAEEGLSLITNKGKVANKLLASNLLNNNSIPQAFEGLIEDESYDDYGPGAGKRYVLKNAHIKSMSITEKSPEFTAVEVQGRFGDNFQYNLPQDLQGFQGGGNALTTAIAVDYDLWRMYGIRVPQSVSAPYLTDPNTQCAPFAVALLNKARKQVQSGTINIIGNEYMQAGEVVYVENQDMLYYVESVQHRIAYGRDFSTTLNVGYGHMPGEYIPTYLDSIGKILYKNREVTNMVSVRHGNVNNEEHIGVIVGDITNSLAAPTDSIIEGMFKNENRQSLNAILQAAETAFNTSGTNYKPKLELRVFYASQTGFGTPSNNAIQIASAVKGYLVGENNLYEKAKTKQPSSWLKNWTSDIQVTSVDSDDIEEFRTPSSHAYGMARSALTKKSTKNTNGTTKVDNVIYNYVVDCWIRFEQG